MRISDWSSGVCSSDLLLWSDQTAPNCGNMLAAVGPYAVWRGLITPQEGENHVRIYTTNTNQVVEVSFLVKNGVPCIEGPTLVNGVPGSGATVSIDFGDCAGRSEEHTSELQSITSNSYAV